MRWSEVTSCKRSTRPVATITRSAGSLRLPSSATSECNPDSKRQAPDHILPWPERIAISRRLIMLTDTDSPRRTARSITRICPGVSRRLSVSHWTRICVSKRKGDGTNLRQFSISASQSSAVSTLTMSPTIFIFPAQLLAGDLNPFRLGRPSTAAGLPLRAIVRPAVLVDLIEASETLGFELCRTHRVGFHDLKGRTAKYGHLTTLISAQKRNGTNRFVRLM